MVNNVGLRQIGFTRGRGLFSCPEGNRGILSIMRSKSYRSGHSQGETKKIEPLRSRATNVIQRGYTLKPQGIIRDVAPEKTLDIEQEGRCGQRLQFFDEPTFKVGPVYIDAKLRKPNNRDTKDASHFNLSGADVVRQSQCSQREDPVVPPRSTSTPIQLAPIVTEKQTTPSLPPLQRYPVLLQDAGSIATPLFCCYHSNSRNCQVVSGQSMILPLDPSLPPRHNSKQNLAPPLSTPIMRNSQNTVVMLPSTTTQPQHEDTPMCHYSQYFNNLPNSVSPKQWGPYHTHPDLQPPNARWGGEECEESDPSPSYTSTGGNATCGGD